ncbi:hypothetical protein [Paraburkholderia terrae]|uniref:Uncharacterized protein n=1 Tax=Paraburkholderia terrae TaxID=311230 RepID=A0A2I8F288_9BURK|nr:hypothetical protein [Paraburkholderia terrae]AUT65840.1 hypothetical protein C2L65_40865 [Paraburkholderia terrae]
MNTIAIASKDAVEDMTGDRRTRQMLRPPEQVSVETEANHGKSNARAGVLTGLAWTKNCSLCPVALGNFMRTSNAYLFSSASEE